ncbi:hypothetical protein D3H65_05790 [Paraflavitalea soli]|uniref:Uncharacterized protein n=1 Tax=Paraflavitalea soli TaxID=2315862 RepID=A0A3B7MIV3_9BACT|nr:TonB-dependent receptor plug domain-containing protein [Paraflavitalea soli]AXY73517.1 hypothetical protein D3H65_05790 [Paraflavitalea soli]
MVKALIAPKQWLWWLVISIGSITTAPAQSDPTISLTVKNKTVKEVADLFFTRYRIAITGDILAERIYVNIRLKNTPVDEALRICFAGLPVKITRHGNNVTITTVGDLWRQKEGIVLDNRLLPLEQVTVKALPGSQVATTDLNGKFEIRVQANADSLVCTHVQVLQKTVPIPPARFMEIVLESRSSDLEQVQINSKKPNAKGIPGLAMGSYEQIDLARKESNLVYDINDVVRVAGSSLLVNKDRYYLRGISTINSDQAPLIILNGFIYEGDLKSINPADIEKLTFYKDAIATSIWGIRASNGVIAIQTKNGNYNSPLQVSFTANAAYTRKTNIFNGQDFLSASDVVDIQSGLFLNGFYDAALQNSIDFPAVPVVAEILDQRRQGRISYFQAEQWLDSLRRNDVRKDLDRYFYKNGFQQQYAVGLQQGDSTYHFNLTVGFDWQRPVLQRNLLQRTTISLNHVQKIPKYKTEIGTSLMVAIHEEQNNNTGRPASLAPYQRLADDKGNPLPVTMDYRDGFTDTAGGGKLLDWKYRPLQELEEADNTRKSNEIVAAVQIWQPILPKLRIQASTQFHVGTVTQEDRKSPETYYTRNLINLFSQVTAGNVINQIPYGTIRDVSNGKKQAFNLSFQCQFTDSALGRHRKVKDWLSISLGADLTRRKEISTLSRDYAWRKDNPPVFINTHDPMPLYIGDRSQRIPTVPDYNVRNNTSFFSAWLTGTWFLRKKWSFSGTLRKESSNLLGIKTNKAIRPLYAIGVGWLLSNEKFFPFKKIIPHLNLKFTYGITTNINKQVSALTTAQSIGTNGYGQPAAVIISPPNPSLQPEITGTTNIGIEMSAIRDLLQIKFDYFVKDCRDLIGAAPLDYTSGLSSYTGNTANMIVNGFELNIMSRYSKGPVHVTHNLLLNKFVDRITRYLSQQSIVSSYLQPGQVSPLQGQSYFAINSLPVAGLDPQTGKLLALVDGHPSIDYNKVLLSPDLKRYLQVSGSSIPTVYGSFYTGINCKGFTLAGTIGFRMGYYFRRTSVSYPRLLLGQQTHQDYLKRWQKPGDELFTNVPVLEYPPDMGMDAYYQSAAFLVENGSHIRLQDCSLNYQFSDKVLKGSKFSQVMVYLYGSNLGILWRANKLHLDPEFPDGNAPGWSVGGGVKIKIRSKQ